MNETSIVTTDSAAAPKRPYGSHVSRVLGAAGFARADAEPTSIRGHYRYSPGFQVSGSDESWESGLLNDVERAARYVTVSHQWSNHLAFAEPADDRPLRVRVAEKVAAYADVLESAGFIVETRQRNEIAHLVVTGRNR